MITSNDAFTGVPAAGMWRTFGAPVVAPAIAATAAPRKRHAAAIAVARKRHTAAGATAASVNRGSI